MQHLLGQIWAAYTDSNTADSHEEFNAHTFNGQRATNGGTVHNVDANYDSKDETSQAIDTGVSHVTLPHKYCTYMVIILTIILISALHFIHFRDKLATLCTGTQHLVLTSKPHQTCQGPAEP